MAVFIPSQPKEGTNSKAERDFFWLLKKKLADKDNVYVFHSLVLPTHEKQISGETDFIIISERGLLCLEVKGGNVSYKNGVWEYRRNDGTLTDEHMDPFKQAEYNIIALRNCIQKRYGQDKYVYAYGVVFPDLRFDVSTVEYNPQMIYDESTDDVVKYIEGVYDFHEKKFSDRVHLNQSVINRLVDFIRIDFDLTETLGIRIEKSKRKVEELTDEQKNIVEELDENPRILVKGSAGTGKTVIAKEFAKRFAEKGKKVLFLFYNRIVAERVEQEMTDTDGKMEIRHIHRLFDGIYKHPACKMPDNYYKDEWPEKCYYVLSQMSEEETEKLRYDVIVMDEAQDMMKMEYLMVLDLLLKGGLKDGNWVILYDERQNIYLSDRMDVMDDIKAYRPAISKLTKNCRNTRKIANFNYDLTGGDKIALLYDEPGEKIEIYDYTSPEELKEKVNRLFEIWKKEAVNKKDVVFLGKHTYPHSRLGMAIGSGFEINDLKDMSKGSKKNTPFYSTIQSFKGLDSPVVVLILGEEKDEDEETRTKLLYTAISRAKAKLYIIAEKQIADEYRKKL